MQGSGSQENSQIDAQRDTQGHHKDSIHRQVTAALDAIEKANPADKQEFARTYCRDDQDLLEEVLSLLRFEDQAEILDKGPVVFVDSVQKAANAKITVPTNMIDGFILERVIGQGAFGVVYEAQQLEPRRKVAIKILRLASDSTDAAKRIQLEGHLAARLEHSSIARVYQSGVLEGPVLSQPYIVMEKADGTPLSEIISNGQLDREIIHRILRELYNAIHYAHEQGVVHRDIKPSNVLVNLNAADHESLICVVDFGIARLVDGSTSPIYIETIDAKTLGTIRYMSPERRTGSSNGASVQSDVYSLGVLTSEILLGSTYRSVESTGPNLGSTGSCLGDQSVKLDIFSASLRRVLARMTAPEVEVRYEQVSDAWIDLEQVLNRGVYFYSDEGLLNRVITSAKRFKSIVYQNRKNTLLSSSVALLSIVALILLSRQETPVVLPSQTKYSLFKPVTLEDAESKWDFINATQTLATRYSSIGQHQKALESLEELEDQIGEFEMLEPIMKPAVWILRADVLRNAGEYDQAVVLYRDLRDEILAHYNEDSPWVWVSAFGTAYGLQRCGESAEARDLYSLLIAHHTFAEQNWWIRSTGLTFYGGFLWTQREYKLAEQMMRQALEDVPETMTLSERKSVAQRKSSLGLILDSQGKHDQAHAYLVQAREDMTDLVGGAEIHVLRLRLNELMNAMYRREFDQALRDAQVLRSIFLIQPNAWPVEIAECDLVIGTAHFLLGNYDTARQVFSESLQQFDNQSNKRLAEVMTRNKSTLAILLQLTDPHEELYTQYLSVLEEFLENNDVYSPWMVLMESIDGFSFENL